MADSLTQFATFVRVVETGSFTAVALEQRSTQPTISRRIAGLEARLGALLFRRTTRSLSLTEEGKRFYDRARAALAAIDEAEGSVGSAVAEPSGVLRIAAAGVLARLHLLPRIGRFLAAHPKVQIDLTIGDEIVDLVEQGIDLAVRVGEPTEPGLIIRRIGATRRIVVAAPEYIARHGKPNRPDDLRIHECVVYKRLATGETWPLRGPNGVTPIPISGRLKLDGTEAVRAAILSGYGIGLVPNWHFVDRELETGRLVRLLRDHEPDPQPVNAVYASRRFLPAKVRAMVEFLADEFARDPLFSP